MTRAIVVGIDKMSNDTLYRVLVFKYEEKASEDKKWSFVCEKMNTQRIIEAIQKHGNNFFMNITVDQSGKISGRRAALSRFDSDPTKGNHPFVIISKIVTEDERLIGYKVGTYDGKVKNISLQEMIGYCLRTTKANLIPIQNCIFVPEDKTSGKKAHIKEYPNCPLITEIKVVGKNKHTQTNRVQVKENEKKLVKASEIFTPEQMKVLAKGKQAGVDIRVYANPKLTPEQMEALLDGLGKGVNVRPFTSPEYTAQAMQFYVYDLTSGLDIRKYLSPKYSLEQLFQLSLATTLGLDINKVSNPKLKANEMAEIIERLKAKIWKDELVKKDGSWI